MPEHTARLVSNQTGLVYEFPNINCSTSYDGKLEISTEDTPFRLRYVADGTGTGMHRTESGVTDYAGGAIIARRAAVTHSRSTAARPP